MERAGPAHTQIQENLFVDGVHEERGRVDRSALGHDPDHVERLKARIKLVVATKAAVGPSAAK